MNKKRPKQVLLECHDNPATSLHHCRNNDTVQQTANFKLHSDQPETHSRTNDKSEIRIRKLVASHHYPDVNTAAFYIGLHMI
jgi:hypothetical protein